MVNMMKIGKLVYFSGPRGRGVPDPEKPGSGYVTAPPITGVSGETAMQAT